MEFGLSKEERICSVSAIEELVAKGRYANLGVIRYCWHKRADKAILGDNRNANREPQAPNRILVSVPKKLFKRAVKRNLLKRRIRESYRLQKHLLDGIHGVDIMFVYNTKEVSEFRDIYAAVESALQTIASKAR